VSPARWRCGCCRFCCGGVGHRMAQASRCPPWPTTGRTANVARVRPPTTPCAGSWQRLASEVRDAAAAAASFPGSWSSSTASSGRGCCTTSGRTRRRGADPRDVGAVLRAPVARTPRDRHDGTRTLGDTHRGPCGRRGRHVPAAPEPGQLSGAGRGTETGTTKGLQVRPGETPQAAPDGV